MGDILDKLSYKYDPVSHACTISIQLDSNIALQSKAYPAPSAANTINVYSLPGLSVWPFLKGNGWYTGYYTKEYCMSEEYGYAWYALESWGSIDNKNLQVTIVDYDKLRKETPEYEQQILYFDELPRYAGVRVVPRDSRDGSGKFLGWICFREPTEELPTPDNERNRALVETSFPMASREIFIEPLRELFNVEGCMDIERRNAIDGIRNAVAEMKTADGQMPCTALKSAAFYEKPVFLLEQALRVPEAAKELQDLIARLKGDYKNRFIRRVVSNFFAMLYFTFEALHEKMSEITDSPDVYLVGNGARLFNKEWMTKQYYNSIERYIKDCICEICKDDRKNLVPNIIVHPVDSDAKTESAQGMLITNGNSMNGVPMTMISGIGLSVRHSLNGNICKVTIPADGLFYNQSEDDSLVKQFLKADPRDIITCSVDAGELREKMGKFLDDLNYNIFDGSLSTNDLDWAEIGMRTSDRMLKAFKRQVIQPPLFCALVETGWCLFQKPGAGYAYNAQCLQPEKACLGGTLCTDLQKPYQRRCGSIL